MQFFSLNQVLLENAMNYMILNPNCKMSDVADHCHISEPGLYLVFKNTGDTTPAKFKMQVKLERALNYILSTDLPIEEISSICGFSSSSYFRKNFYSAYKKTPREMRKSDIANNEESKEPFDNPDNDQHTPKITYIAVVVAALSLAANVVLVVLLINEKKKSAVVPYDPSERTDFDIDILE